MAPLSDVLRVSGTIRVPGDKSISHRALIVGALSEGATRITGLLQSADVRSTAAALRALRANVPALSDDFVLDGVGTRGLRSPDAPLDCGNSGTSARLLAGVVAGQHATARFIGDASLSRRPMARVARPLVQMGARVELTAQGHLPMTVIGGDLVQIDYSGPVASAQIKSAILLAALCAGVEATIREPQQSRDHTERMLAARGAEVWVNDDAVMLWPTRTLPALDVAVPGDPSSAAFMIGLAALAGTGELRVPDVCLNETRVGFFRAIAEMGARIEVEDERVEGGETVGTLVCFGGRQLRGMAVDEGHVPSMVDELPLLACMAARATGETVIRGAAELRVKESDRIAVVVANLRALGADADELADGLIVRGSQAPLRGRVETHGDHRIAMAFGVLGTLPDCAIELDDAGCVDVSYPTFWRDLASATA